LTSNESLCGLLVHRRLYRSVKQTVTHFQIDRGEFLPAAHGFDEFCGSLYHLGAEKEPELADCPKVDDAKFPELWPGGVICSFAMPDGTRKIEDTGSLRERWRLLHVGRLSSGADARGREKPEPVYSTFTRKPTFRRLRCRNVAKYSRHV
jgi:hypothetical protein